MAVSSTARRPFLSQGRRRRIPAADALFIQLSYQGHRGRFPADQERRVFDAINLGTKQRGHLPGAGQENGIGRVQNTCPVVATIGSGEIQIFKPIGPIGQEPILLNYGGN